MNRRVIKSVVIILLLSILLAQSSFAHEKQSSKEEFDRNLNVKVMDNHLKRYVNGKQVNFEISPAAQGQITEKNLLEIAKQAAEIVDDDTIKINIENVVFAESNST